MNTFSLIIAISVLIVGTAIVGVYQAHGIWATLSFITITYMAAKVTAKALLKKPRKIRIGHRGATDVVIDRIWLTVGKRRIMLYRTAEVTTKQRRGRKYPWRSATLDVKTMNSLNASIPAVLGRGDKFLTAYGQAYVNKADITSE
ncbi:hypothetical protein ACPV5O_26530 [Vibrio maritimus]|jgi:hypothetical protein|uniref:hypothetical protein n=1 Tax=Vibrio maritimus TaxID=990268 RepID=UPI004068FFBE